MWERNVEGTWVKKGELLRLPNVEFNPKITYVEFSPKNSDEIVVALSDGSSEVRNLVDDKWIQMSTFRAPELTDEEMKALNFRSDLDNHERPARRRGSADFSYNNAVSAHFSKDGNKIVITNLNRAVYVCEAQRSGFE